VAEGKCQTQSRSGERSMVMRLNVRLISWQKKTFEQIAQPRGSRSKKHQTSKCFVSQFPSELREITSPPTGSSKLGSKSRSYNMPKSSLHPILLPSGSHERHAVAAKTSCCRFGRTDLSRFMPYIVSDEPKKRLCETDGKGSMEKERNIR
jgi:hypothetical protein